MNPLARSAFPLSLIGGLLLGLLLSGRVQAQSARLADRLNSTAEAAPLPALSAPEAAPPTVEILPSDINVPVGTAVGSPAPLATEAVVAPEPLPLQEETMRWYAYPWRWFNEGWTNHVEFGLNGSTGNSRTLSLQTGAEMKRKTDLYTLAFDFDYVRTTTAGVLTQNSGRLNADFDRLLGDTRWSAFGKLGLEWNEFKPFDLRVNANSGAGYHWLRDETSTFITRFGAGASREIGSPDDDWIPEALFGVESEHQLTPSQRIKAKIDYFPNWSGFDDYRLVSDVSWEILLDGTDNLSLKLAATSRYDSTPQGALPHDLMYSLLLLYKF